jgi:hypothetical protein
MMVPMRSEASSTSSLCQLKSQAGQSKATNEIFAKALDDGPGPSLCEEYHLGAKDRFEHL